MSDKSYVTLEQKQCFICFSVFDTGSLLMHKQLKPVFDKFTVTGYDLCVDCKKKKDEDYVALIVATPPSNLHNKPIRTGEYIHMRKEVFERCINSQLPQNNVCFIDPELALKIREWARK